jgi:hypothetical protein
MGASYSTLITEIIIFAVGMLFLLNKYRNEHPLLQKLSKQ